MNMNQKSLDRLQEAVDDLKRYHQETAQERRVVIPETKTCSWKHDDEDGAFDTECGNRFQMEDGTPEDNGFRFCTYCGGRLVVVREGENEA
jgi:hypothetical protein